MKLKVERSLNNGSYGVAIDVSSFTPEEVRKMGLFGIPKVLLTRQQQQGGRVQVWVPLNQIKEPLISFPDEETAREYEDRVKSQISEVVRKLRESEDEYTSAEEVEL